VAQLLAGWKADLEDFRNKLQAVGDKAGQKDRLVSGWPAVPDRFSAVLTSLR